VKTLHRLLTLVLVLVLCGLLTSTLTVRPVSSQTVPGVVLDGFTAQASVSERSREEQFRAVPGANSAREHLRRLTAEPHVAGTKEDYATAVYVRDQIRSYGLPAELKEYDVLLPYPRVPSIVEIVGRRRERLSVKEAVIPEDPTSSSSKIIGECRRLDGTRTC
jgi:hypothetical protein